MSSRKSSTKRKRKQEGDSTEEESAAAPTECTVFGGWLDEGFTGGDGVTEHEGFSLTLGGKSFEISLGDAVLMRSTDEDGTMENQDAVTNKDPTLSNGSSREANGSGNGMIARVERIWEINHKSRGDECPFMFQARWFLRKQDLESLRGEFAMSAWDLDFINKLTDSDLILSNQADDNALTTIAGDIQVVYRRPESDPILPAMPTDMYVCRYSVSFGKTGDGTDEGLVRIIPFAGQDDKWDDFVSSSGEKALKRPRAESETLDPTLPNDVTTISTKLRTYYSESEDSLGEDFRAGTAVISEGAIDHRNTRVGPEHQVLVPPFSPNQTIVSRQPTQVWKPQQISREGLRAFITKASHILVPYLRRNGLTHTEPYSPLAWDQMEELAKELGHDKMPSLSTICTASALSEKRTDMLREVNADSLLGILHDHSYNVDTALQAIRASPKSFVTSMTTTQKDIVNATFRRYAGSLRMVYKALAPNKTFQDVIDYVYRYKIPDQFRLFQETKREQAIRMLECIESRRNINATLSVNSNREDSKSSSQSHPERKTKNSDWQKTSTSEVIGALDERRSQAKRLLLDIEDELGFEKMKEVALLINSFHQRPAMDSRTRLLGILHGSDHLKQRMLEFLPKRF